MSNKFRDVKYEFYQVKLEKGTTKDFAALIKRVHDMAPGDRNRPVGDYPIRLQDVLQGIPAATSEMVKIRMHDAPTIADLAGTVRPLSLGETEGLGESTAFMFVPGPNVIVVQRNRHGISAGAIAQYFEHFCSPTEINFMPILNKDAYKRLSDMDDYRRLTYKFARPHDINLVKKHNADIDDTLDILERMGGESIEVTVSLDRKKVGSLEKNPVSSLVKDMFRIGRDQIKTIELHGRNSKGKSETIDFITNRLVETVRLSIDSIARCVPDSERHRGLRDAYERQTDYIKAVTGKHATT